MSKRGLQFISGIRQTEDRFMDKNDKDLLIMIVDSMIKGQMVSVKKVHEFKNKAAQNQIKQSMQEASTNVKMSQ